MASLGENIKNARINKGMTQEELATMLKTSKAAISRYELNQREPRTDQLRAIADVLEVSVGYLQGYEHIDTRKILNAIKKRDCATVEKLLGLPAGSILNMPVGEVPSFENDLRKSISATDDILDNLRAHIAAKYEDITFADQAQLKLLIDAFSQLNNIGQTAAIVRVEELSELRKYRKGSFPQD